MKSDPLFHSNSNCSDLGLVSTLADPNSNSAECAMRIEVKCCKSIDHPSFERMNEAPQILPALFEVDHDINDPLTRTMIV